MLEECRKHAAERAAEGLVCKPLCAEFTAQLVELVKNPPAGKEKFLLELLVGQGKCLNRHPSRYS